MSEIFKKSHLLIELKIPLDRTTNTWTSGFMLHILYIAKSSSTAIIKAWNAEIGKPDQEEPDQNANEPDQPKQ